MPVKIAPFACLAAVLLALPIHAATIVWTGGGDGVNWSDAANWGGTAPGTADTAQFPNQPAGLSTIVNAAFGGTVQFVNLQQSTLSATNAISLARELVLSSNNGTGSGLTYAATISNPAMIAWDLNGNYLRFSSSSTSHKINNLHGTFILDTAGSRIGTARYAGTSADDLDTFNFGSGSNLAKLDVTANAQIGRVTTGTTTSNGLRLTTINIGAGSEVHVSNNARLDFIYRGRSDGGTLLAANNSGAVNLAAGSTVGTIFEQVNNSDRTINISFNNLAAGTMNHHGTLAMQISERGTATISNAGLWKAGANAVITGTNANAGAGDFVTVAFTNQAPGVLTNASSGSLDYNPLSPATRLNQTLTITNQGTISPGAGHNGSGLTSVGTFTLTDIHVTFTGAAATLRIDLGGLTPGSQHDVLTLTNGALTLDANSKLVIYYVNGFNGTAGNSWTILNYNSATTTGFDLASALSIVGGTGAAADPNNYTLTFGSGSATLTLIPEPGSLALALAGGLIVMRRRRA